MGTPTPSPLSPVPSSAPATARALCPSCGAGASLGGPVDFGARDLLALAVLSASKGAPDQVGWPCAKDLLPYYERAFSPPGTAVELPGQPGVLWGDVAALAEADATAFVSLCRIGTGQRRGAEHHEVWLTDGPDNAHLPFVLADTADAVETLRRDHGTVFVHCVRCESRTPAVAIAWLMRHHGLGQQEALAEVRQVMPLSQASAAMREALCNM